MARNRRIDLTSGPAAKGQIWFKELSGSGINKVILQAPDNLAGDLTLNLPAADLASGVLKSDGSGNLAFSLVTNAMVDPSAAIAYSKLNLAVSIVNADIASGAAIAFSKLAALTVSRALVSDGAGVVSVSAVTATELGYVSGVTSAIQTQLNAKASTSDLSSHEADTTNIHGIADTTNLATKTGVETLTNKTISSPTINTPTTDVLNLDDQGSDPSSPSAGFVKVYAKTDGKLYKKTSDGTVTEIGSGAGGINYILNPDAEGDAAGWATYKDAAQSTPVDGTGGSPTLTWTRSTSSPLRGVANFLLTKAASNLQGEGASYAFTIDAADQAKMLSCSFDYKIASGTYADGDVTIWVYDVTNGSLVAVVPNSLMKTTGHGKFQAEFQSNSNSVSYRLIFHVASTSASAFTVQVDNVQVGPQPILFGAPVTDWVPYPVVVTGLGSPSLTEVESRRVGDALELRGKITSGTSTSVELRVSLGYGGVNGNVTSGDTTKIPTIKIAGTGCFSSVVGAIPTVLIEPSKGYVTFGTQDAGHGGLTKMNGDDFISPGVTFSFFASLPIQGWGSSVTMSDQASTRVVAAKTGLTSSLAVTQDTPFVYDTLVFDTHGSYSASTGLYTVPVTGKYRVSITGLQVVGAATNLYVAINGVNKTYLAGFANGSIASGSTLVDVIAGDTIAIQPDATQTFAGNAAFYNTLSVERVSGPSAIAASEKIVVVATWPGGAYTTGNDIPFDTKLKDSHGAFNFSTGEFTCPRADDFLVTCYAQNSTGTQSSMQIYKNGVFYLEISTCPNGSNNSYQGSVVVANCLAGDVISVQLNASVTITAGANLSICSV